VSFPDINYHYDMHHTVVHLSHTGSQRGHMWMKGNLLTVSVNVFHCESFDTDNHVAYSRTDTMLTCHLSSCCSLQSYWFTEGAHMDDGWPCIKNCWQYVYAIALKFRHRQPFCFFYLTTMSLNFRGKHYTSRHKIKTKTLCTKCSKATGSNTNQISQKWFNITSENRGNRGIIVYPVTEMHDRSFSWLGTYTPIKSGEVTCKLVISAQTSPLQWCGHKSDFHIWVNIYLILWRFGHRQLFCLF
jgi:hypothetical protein